VTLDGASPLLAGIDFADAGKYTIAQGTGGTLHLANGTSTATVTVLAGTQTISAPVIFDSNVAISAAAGSKLTVSGDIDAQGNSLTVSGLGTVALTGANNSFASVAVTSGKLILGSSTTLVDGGSLTIGDAALFSPIIATAATTTAPAVTTSAIAIPAPSATPTADSTVGLSSASNSPLNAAAPQAAAAPSSELYQSPAAIAGPIAIRPVRQTPPPAVAVMPSQGAAQFQFKPVPYAAKIVTPTSTAKSIDRLARAVGILAEQNSQQSNRDNIETLRAFDAVFAQYAD
jgi:hypothetical protein